MIAVQASLTGHMVLTTLHTIDAASSVTRLMDIGIESYKIAAAIKGVVAQRLLRRLCPNCRELVVEPMPDRLKPVVSRSARCLSPRRLRRVPRTRATAGDSR